MSAAFSSSCLPSRPMAGTSPAVAASRRVYGRDVAARAASPAPQNSRRFMMFPRSGRFRGALDLSVALVRCDCQTLSVRGELSDVAVEEPVPLVELGDRDALVAPVSPHFVAVHG